jgi:hypothetical protein
MSVGRHSVVKKLARVVVVVTTIMFLMACVLPSLALAQGLPGVRPARDRDNAQGGTIQGVVFQDWDENGMRDAQEPTLAEAVVTLYDAQGQEIARYTTDRDGNYGFENLPAGDYTLVETESQGYSSLQGNTVLVELEAGEVAKVDFANVLWLEGLALVVGIQ